jgi:hypothetical protein
MIARCVCGPSCPAERPKDSIPRQTSTRASAATLTPTATYCSQSLKSYLSILHVVTHAHRAR